MVKVSKVWREQSVTELSKKDIYKMTMNDNIASFKDIVDGEMVENIVAVVFYDDEKESGEIAELVSVVTKAGDIYAGNSSIINRKLNEILELFAVDSEKGIFEEPFTILKMSGESKNKRKFTTITLV